MYYLLQDPFRIMHSSSFHSYMIGQEHVPSVQAALAGQTSIPSTQGSPFLTAGFKENTMLMSFGNKFIRRDQKQRRNGEACRANPTYFWSSLNSMISNDQKTLT